MSAAGEAIALRLQRRASLAALQGAARVPAATAPATAPAVVKRCLSCGAVVPVLPDGSVPDGGLPCGH